MKKPTNLAALRKEFDLVLEMQPNAKIVTMAGRDYYIADFPGEKADTLLAIDVEYHQAGASPSDRMRTHIVPARIVQNNIFILDESFGYDVGTFMHLLKTERPETYKEIISFLSS